MEGRDGWETSLYVLHVAVVCAQVHVGVHVTLCVYSVAEAKPSYTPTYVHM